MASADDTFMDAREPKRWDEMSPDLRMRFHDLGNHISRVEGIVTGLSMHIRPESIPLIEARVTALEAAQSALREALSKSDERSTSAQAKTDQKLDAVNEKLNGFALKVVGGTTVLTTLVGALIQVKLGGAR